MYSTGVSDRASLPTLRESNQHIVNLLVQYLRDVIAKKDGSIARFSEMSEICNCKITSSDHRMQRAKRILQDDHGCLLDSVHGVGYRYLEQSEAAQTVGTVARKKIIKTTAQWRDRHETIKPDQLSQTDLNKYIQESLRLRAQEDVNSNRTNDRIAAAMEGQPQLTNANLREILLKASDRLRNVG